MGSNSSNQIPYDKYITAYRVFREITKSPRNENTKRAFHRFLNVPENFVWHWHFGPGVSPDGLGSTIITLKERIDLLLSAHANALYAIWRAQQEDKCQE